LILSGVLDGRYDHVLSHFVDFELIERVVIDGWATLCLKRHD
jgi:ribosomal protein L11 methylase PrmA